MYRVSPMLDFSRDVFFCSFGLFLVFLSRSFLAFISPDGSWWLPKYSAWLIAPLIWSPAGRNAKLKTSKELLSATAESWPFPPLKVYNYYIFTVIRRRMKPWWQGSRGVSLFQVDGFFSEKINSCKVEEKKHLEKEEFWELTIANFLQTMSPLCSNPFCMEWVNFRYLYKHLLTGYLEE